MGLLPLSHVPGLVCSQTLMLLSLCSFSSSSYLSVGMTVAQPVLLPPSNTNSEFTLLGSSPLPVKHHSASPSFCYY